MKRRQCEFVGLIILPGLSICKVSSERRRAVFSSSAARHTMVLFALGVFARLVAALVFKACPPSIPVSQPLA